MTEAEIRWFFIDDAGNLRGPANLETLSLLVESGVVNPSTQMRREDSDEWAPAETFFDFAADETPPPPPPPKPEPKPPPLPAANGVRPLGRGASVWFYDDPVLHAQGPVSLERVFELIRKGTIAPDTTTRSDDCVTWRPAEAFFDFDAIRRTPPPLPPSIPNVIDKSPQLSYMERMNLPEAEMRGIQGEEEMLRVLESGLPLGGDRGYRIVRNLMFETPTGTTQLDFAVVSAFGIFILEVKNYSGWIFGDPDDKRWTQSLRGGVKFPFQNPIHQNFRHLAVLSEKTGIPQNVIFPLVAFANGCDFKTQMPANVCHFDEVAGYIRRFRSIIIKPEQLTEIMQTFLAWDNAIDREKKRDHVQNLKEAHAPASVHDRNVLCPVCGNRMVLRRSRRDGNQFWGCSKYPGCRGIRQAVDEQTQRGTGHA